MAKQVDSGNVGGLLEGVFTKIKNAFWAKGDTQQLSIDSTPTANSANLVSSGGVKAYVDGAAEIFWVTYGTTTATEIQTALDANKVVLAKTSAGITVPYQRQDANYMYFGCIYGANSTYIILSKSNNSYTSGTWELERSANKTSDISTNRTDTTKYPTTKGVYNEVHPAVASSQPAGGMLPNVMYNLGTLTGTVTFSLASPTDNEIVNHYYWTFTAGSTAPTITWPSGISWAGGDAPTVEAGHYYEISVYNNVGAFLDIAPSS